MSIQIQAQIVRLPIVQEITGLSRAGVYQLIGEGNFPKQIKIGKRASGWVKSEVLEWIQERIAARDSAA